MKRKRNQLFVTALTAAMAVSLLSPAEPAAAAKKVKFNVKTLSLTVGKKKTLKIKNAKKKAKWSIKSGKDKIKLQKKKKASVVVAAKKAGSAKVQAKVGKKKYVCKVVVKAKTVKNGTSAGTKITNKPADTKMPRKILGMDRIMQLRSQQTIRRKIIHQRIILRIRQLHRRLIRMCQRKMNRM